ncbi:MAG: CapA family protein, partial [Candidatus Cloacimonetes bacterium]|nr:CapA family protein [Candidatus Cloacimonadota bacterium]
MFKPTLLIAVLVLLFSVLYSAVRETPIETFDSGVLTLTSWADEDINPESWSLDTATGDGSAYCLKLTGNTWKLQQIVPYAIDSIGVVQVKAKTSTNLANVQGIGFTDGQHQLFYSFAGTRVMDIEAWVPVYQGAFEGGVWNTYKLPLASDWQAFFGYLPVLQGIIYVNDLDGLGNRTVYFDAVEDISEDLPVPPIVSISATAPTGKNLGIFFSSTVVDPDSDTFSYLWDFGDSGNSTQPNPYHLYTGGDAHPYTVSLKVTDDTGKCGYASIGVTIDAGESSLPLKMNFIGDVMLARRYENTGGIIPTYGVNAIFAPTKPIYGDIADISVANLEVVLSNGGTPHPSKSVVYRGNPSNISGLSFAGIDLVSLAHNHTLDCGLRALQQMQ